MVVLITFFLILTSSVLLKAIMIRYQHCIVTAFFLLLWAKNRTQLIRYLLSKLVAAKSLSLRFLATAALALAWHRMITYDQR